MLQAILDAFAKQLQKVTTSPVMSFILFTWKSATPTGWLFVKFHVQHLY